MKTISFIHGVTVAAVLAVIGAISYAALAMLWPGTLLVKVLIAALHAGYLGFIMLRSNIRRGRITMPFAWLLAALAIGWSAPTLAIYLVAHTALLWLFRSLCRHRSALSALVDCAVCAAAAIAALATAAHSASVFLTVWCLFLIHALFAFVPTSWSRTPAISTANPAAGFERARKQAEEAFRRLSLTP